MEKPSVTPQHISYVEGELLATQAAVRALILLAPDPLAAASAVSMQIEKLISTCLASAHTNEAQIQGMQAAKRALLPTPRDLAGPDPQPDA